ncbi:MAG: DUF2135 domain-containing protein [Magnetococcales bacterium]|nr:DUF2135 domain-containing protein [Magnetococcales bacterium]
MKRPLALLVWLLSTVWVGAAGFDCQKAATPVERLICGDAELVAADSRMVDIFNRLQEVFKEDETQRTWHKQTQLTWLKETRNRCGDVACLKEVYRQRNVVLEQLVPQPIVLDGPIGGWRNDFGEEVVYVQQVNYPATGVNTQEEGDQFGVARKNASLIRGRIASHLKPSSDQPLKMIVNGIPMPLLLDEDGRFARPYLFGTGSNGVEIRSPDGSAVVRRQFYEAYNEKVRPRMRIVLSWDSNGTDLDLHVITPKGEHCAYFNRAIPSGGALDVDVTTGFGPEIFSHPTPPAGQYLLYLNYFGDGSDDRHPNPLQPITVATITVVTEENTPDEKMRTFTVPVRRPGELVEVAKFLYP